MRLTLNYIMLKKIILLTTLSSFSLFAGTINIAVAANVSYTIDSLKKEFHNAYPDTKVRVTLGSSGKLTAQIKHGAPYDIFMSANMKFPNSLYKDKIALTKPIIYAKGSLALLSKKQIDFKDGIALIAKKNIRRIAIANPKTAPYGQASLQAIKNAKLYNSTKSRFIYGESASQTLFYTMSATDIGFVAKSALFSPRLKHLKENKNWIELDAKLYTPIEQGVVILKYSKNREEVQNFYNFILSKNAQQIFKEYGYK